MINFGSTLRQARLAKGLTTNQAAEKTHILVQIIEDLENEDFSRIAAPIYGRGFVKLYCEALDIPDPQPLVREFMEIYNGNRPPVIRMRADPQPPPPAPPPSAPSATSVPVTPFGQPTPVEQPVLVEQPVPVAAAAPSADPIAEEIRITNMPAEEPTFQLESVTIHEPAPSTALEAPVRESAPAISDPPSAPASSDAPPVRLPRKPSRYAAPRPIDDAPGFTLPKINIPPYVWRLTALAVAGLLVLWLLIVGVRALYRLTMTAPAPETTVTETETVTDAKPSATPVAPAEKSTPTGPAATVEKRTPLPIKPLYID